MRETVPFAAVEGSAMIGRRACELVDRQNELFFGRLIHTRACLLARRAALFALLDELFDTAKANRTGTQLLQDGDLGADQYEDLSTHDGTRAYGAITAERLGADYFGQAVSGIGLTATWHDMLQHQVWDRVAPRLDAPIAPPDPVKPEIVVINLGQNDHGFPNSMGQKLSPDFGSRYLDFLRQVRQRHPDARLVIAVGGMTAWKDEPRLAKALDDAYAALRAEGDPLVWRYNFQAFAYAHPRIDVHAQMADELTHFLRTEVLK